MKRSFTEALSKASESDSGKNVGKLNLYCDVFFVVRRAPKAAALSPFRFPPLTICPKNTNHLRKKYLSFINESQTDILYIGYSCLMFTEVYSFTHLFSLRDSVRLRRSLHPKAQGFERPQTSPKIPIEYSNTKQYKKNAINMQ